MILTFLKAARPLSKAISYSARDDTFTVSHYPMVKRMTSNEVTVDNMLEFAQAIKLEGKAGKCLLFGSLEKPLADESRAGLARKDLRHEWIMFDFDKVDAPPTMEGALKAIKDFLPPYCQRPECVIQLSPSCFHPQATKLSAHVFMRLAEPQEAKRLKEFLVFCNFRQKELVKQLKLTESKCALSCALDRCVADPSRLVYIAPPRTEGFKSPVSANDYIAHFAGEPSLKIPEFTSITNEEQRAKINSLRTEEDLPPQAFTTIQFRGMEILKHHGEAVISDLQSSGGNFIRFNLNGGNSLGYWINLEHPEIIGNFKGEPFLFTKQVDEKFYKKLIMTTRQMPASIKGGDGPEVLTFYATNRGSRLHVGTYDRGNDVLRVDESNETAAFSWLKQFGIPIKPTFPHYDLVYDITSNTRYEDGYPMINLYARTNFMKQFADNEQIRSTSETVEHLKKTCPVIMKFAESMCGDPRSLEGFLNWLGCIFQFRIKTETAWLFWGVEGTGKGKFIQHVCRPLFGNDNVAQVLMNNVDSTFNSLLEGKLIVNIDEAEMSRTRDKQESMSKLRNWITEPSIVINRKNQTEREVPSFANFIVTANSFRPLMINSSDRRFHVGTRQDTRLIPTPNEFAILSQGEELVEFARGMAEIQINEDWVRIPEQSQQKSRLFESTHNLIDNVALALREGDAPFFFEARPSSVALGAMSSTALMPIKEYDNLLRCMVDDTLNVLRHEDLYVLFSVVVNDTKQFPENTTVQKQIFTRYGFVRENKKTMYCRRLKRSTYGVVAPEWKEVPPFLQEGIIPQLHIVK